MKERKHKRSAGNEVCVEVNEEKTNRIFTSRQQTARQTDCTA